MLAIPIIHQVFLTRGLLAQRNLALSMLPYVQEGL
jgi:hypothetical protein